MADMLCQTQHLAKSAKLTNSYIACKMRIIYLSVALSHMPDAIVNDFMMIAAAAFHGPINR